MSSAKTFILYKSFLKSEFPSSQFDTLLVRTSVSQSNISDSYYWSWQGTAVSVVLVCCLTGFNILCPLIVCCACVRGVSLRKKMPPNDLLGNNEAISWLRVEKLCCPPLPSLSAGLCPLWEVRNLARCAKCLWSIITERVLDLACLPPHLVACCLKHILLYN